MKECDIFIEDKVDSINTTHFFFILKLETTLSSWK